jgi:hypothetical protein
MLQSYVHIIDEWILCQPNISKIGMEPMLGETPVKAFLIFLIHRDLILDNHGTLGCILVKILYYFTYNYVPFCLRQALLISYLILCLQT